MKRLSILLALLLPCAAAQAEVYKCVGPNGHITYTNERPSTKGCSTLSEDQAVTSFPRIRAETPSSSPADFPRVSPDEQKSRDGGRLKILQDELAAEEQSLESARKALEVATGAGGNTAGVKTARDKVELHERNVEALKKEMGALR